MSYSDYNPWPAWAISKVRAGGELSEYGMWTTLDGDIVHVPDASPQWRAELAARLHGDLGANLKKWADNEPYRCREALPGRIASVHRKHAVEWINETPFMQELSRHVLADQRSQYTAHTVHAPHLPPAIAAAPAPMSHFEGGSTGANDAQAATWSLREAFVSIAMSLRELVGMARRAELERDEEEEQPRVIASSGFQQAALPAARGSRF